MNNIFFENNWAIWFCIIVLIPFKLYDFYKARNKNIISYFSLFFYILFLIAAGICTIFSHNAYFINSTVLYILIVLAYLHSVFDCITTRKIRNYLYFGVFTLFIISLLIFKITH